MKRALTAMFVAALWLGPGLGSALADPSPADLAAARRLFAAALDAEDHGRFKEALDTYQKVAAIAVSSPLYYHLGICYEAIGELVEALNTFDLAAQLAEQRREVEVARESKTKIAALQKRVPTLLVRLPQEAHDVIVAVDDRPMSAALVGTRVPVNPGERRITVRAGSHTKTFERTIRFVEGQAHAIDPDLGDKREVNDPPPPQPPPKPTPIEPPKPLLPDTPIPPRMAPNYAPAVGLFGSALVCGTAALITGVFARTDHVRYDELNRVPPLAPFAERKELYDRGRALALSSTVLTFTMLAAGALGAYFAVVPPRRPVPRVAFGIGDRAAFVALGGGF